MQGNPSPSSVAGLEVQKREIIQEIQNCKSKLALLNEEYAKLSKKQQVARERDAQSPILQKNLLHELLKNPKRRSDSNQQKLNKSPTNTLFQGPREMVVEQFSRLRMVNVKVTNAEFGDRMKNRRYIKMDEIERLMIDGDIPGDFVIIGILVHQKTLILEDTTIKVLLLSDLHQNYVRVFLVADALTKEFTKDSIIAILNPQILIPSKV